ncbi:MAG: hypothetical protein H0T47_24515 [Planctomycetaceae bacterium]|nr:hypothetical protein [Planctomycetaceae bacterium]
MNAVLVDRELYLPKDCEHGQGLRTRIAEHVAAFGKRMWKRLSCGAGTKGERLYEWAIVS